MGKLKKRVQNWYRGNVIGRSITSGLIVSGKRPWLARAADWCWEEKKWIITTLIVVIGLALNYFRR